MTSSEKIDILSFNFDFLWYKIWLVIPTQPPSDFKFDMSSASAIIETLTIMHKRNDTISPHFNNIRYHMYIRAKSKFLSLKHKRILSIIHNTLNTHLIWELPKGRLNNNESKINCAVREFKEETDIDLCSYVFVPTIKPIIESYISAGIRYYHMYYVAYMLEKTPLQSKFNAKTFSSEIENVKWVKIDELKFVDVNNRLYPVVKRIFNIFNNKYQYQIKN